MEEISCQVGARRQLIWPAIHDATSFAVRYLVGHSLTIDVQRLDQTRVRLQLDQLQEVNITELWSAMIISDVMVWPADQVPEDLWAFRNDGWNALLYDRLDATRAGAAAHAIAGRTPTPLLISVETSYGADIAAVCGNLRAFELDQ